MGNCVICDADTKATAMICERCAEGFTKRLAWLARIGMPALRAVAYRQVSLTTPSQRGARTAGDLPPVNEKAETLYITVERFLQRLAGRIGVTPAGHDRDDNPVTLLDWERLIPHLLGWSGRIWKLPDLADRYTRLNDLCEQVEHMIERPPERRLVGICPECERTLTDGTGEPLRTPILAAPGDEYAVCPECGAFLTLSRVRLAYLKRAGLMHITRTQGEAAKWVRDNIGVHVSGRDLMNARQQGRISPRHIEGRYWEWDIADLLAVAERKTTSTRKGSES